MTFGLRIVAALGFALAASGTVFAQDSSETVEGDVAAGEKVYKKCKACHAVEDGKNKVGPHLFAVLDRPAAAVEGFKYSKAMKAAAEEGLVWDIASLAEYLAAPKKMIKGTKMAFVGLKKPEDVTNVIAYLAQFKPE